MHSLTFIITAGGIGKRMGTKLPKQFLLLKGKPILMHTLTVFQQAFPTAQLIVTLPEDWKNLWKELCETHEFQIAHELVSGGIERYHSIQLAIKQAKGEIIGVHDGVRPLLSVDLIRLLVDEAIQFDSAVPVLSLKESLRFVSQSNTHAVKRSEYVSVQTPQLFRRKQLIAAYDIPFHEGITDDASLVEEAGFQIHLVEGEEQNIKITSALDLQLAEFYLSTKD